jgi:hypothetical protein
MKRPPILVLCLLFASMYCNAQDLSSFYQITGFHLPALKSGQYMLTLTPQYSSAPSDVNTTSFPFGNPSTQTFSYASQFTESYFRLATSALYGLSDRTTLSVALEATPGQSLGDQLSSSYNSSGSFSFAQLNATNYRTDTFFSSITLAHRMQPNVELSILGAYSVSNTPVSGITSQTSTSGGVSTTSNGTSASSSKYRSFNIQASVVILGN